MSNQGAEGIDAKRRRREKREAGKKAADERDKAVIKLLYACVALGQDAKWRPADSVYAIPKEQFLQFETALAVAIYGEVMKDDPERLRSMLEGKDIARRRRLAYERSILQTVSDMISVIPEGEEMKEELRKWKDSVFLELPESNQHQWRQVAVILRKLMPFCNLNGWQSLVMMEWNGDQGVPPPRCSEETP